MAEQHLTDAQKSVIEHENGALLVSAAAGSGKTFVLVQRLLRKICDPDSDCNVDDFLIITFTNAAAAELRAKISKAIRERLASDEQNEKLRRQLSRVYLAHISTVHAFCGEILREYAYLRDFTSDFRVLEDTSAQELKDNALDLTVEQIFADPDADPDRSEMLRRFAFLHDDRMLREFILNIHKLLCSQAFPEEWIASCKRALSVEGAADLAETVWGEDILRRTRLMIEDLRKLMQDAGELNESTPGLHGLQSALSSDLDQLTALSRADTWEALHRFGALSFPRIGNADKEYEGPEKARIHAIRNYAKDALKKICSPFALSSEEALRDISVIAPALRGLLDAACLFDRNYRQIKRNRKLLDFNDLEHETVGLLTHGRRGEVTAEAKEISSRFCEIMVDEYQDTNEVQDVIFSSISREGKNLVMVGDVKQSIYRFRLADPTIFLKKYRAFSEHPDSPGEPRKILLSNNFRSRREILDAANFVFRTVMSERVGDVVYGEGEELRPNPHKQMPELPGDKVELHLIDSKDSDEDRSVTEARFVARRIRALLEEGASVIEDDKPRPIRPNDIAILLEALSNAPDFLEALEAEGIPAHCEREESILDTSEVLTLFSCLRILDNPHQDVPLLGVLTSPVCGLTADELAEIRCEDLRADYYGALCKYAERNEEAAAFLQTIKDLRELRRWLPTDDFLGVVVQKFELIPLFSALHDGDQRCRNLHHILRILRGIVRNGAGTLTELIAKIDLLLENPKDVGAKESGDGVTIMTIHKSKGLEFPIVFLSELSRQFNYSEQKSAVLVDNTLGIGSSVIEPDQLLKYANVSRLAIVNKIKADAVSERMRLLYVAMTRAKERLVMTFAYKGIENKLQSIACLADQPLSPAVAAGVPGMGFWVIYAAALRPEAADCFGGMIQAKHAEYPWRIEVHKASETEAAEEKECTRLFGSADLSALDHSYDLRASRVPAKLTATQIKGRSLDEESAEHALPATAKMQKTVRERVFDPNRTELMPTEKGTALHLFLQFCDYAACTTAEGIEAEKCRLLTNRFLTERQIAAVDAERVLRFFESDLGKLVSGSANVHREFKFSILTNAESFSNEGAGERLLLQGVIDCYVETENGIILLDYKTDRIRPGQEAERAEAYRMQLRVYADAISRILKKPVIRCCLYFFATGAAVDLTV